MDVMELCADNVVRNSMGVETSRESIGYIDITKISHNADSGRMLVKFKLNDLPELHYMFGRVITASLWELHNLDAGCSEDTAKALLIAERPAFNSVAKVAWGLPLLEVTEE
jgi:hypothetical protein